MCKNPLAQDALHQIYIDRDDKFINLMCQNSYLDAYVALSDLYYIYLSVCFRECYK